MEASYYLTTLATSEVHPGCRSSELQTIIYRQWRSIVLTVQDQNTKKKACVEVSEPVPKGRDVEAEGNFALDYHLGKEVQNFSPGIIKTLEDPKFMKEYMCTL